MVDDYRLSIMNNLKNIINEMKYISHKTNIDENDKDRLKYLYEQRNYLVHELILLSSSYYLVDSMFQQEIRNYVIYKQNFLKFWAYNLFEFCSCCNYIQLPNEYKNPYDCGPQDEKNKQPLLRKILNII